MSDHDCCRIRVTACSMDARNGESENLGTTREAIDEINCSFRAVAAPTSGATFSSVSLAHCAPTGSTSPNSSYNYTNYTNAYIVDYLSIADNPSPSTYANRAKFDLLVGPGNPPSTQAACQSTRIKFYVFGTDADGTLWNYAEDPNHDAVGLSATGSWVAAGGIAGGGYCTFNGNEPGLTKPVDLNQFNDDHPGRIQSVRVVAQVTNTTGTTRYPVKVSINAANYTTTCVNRAAP